VQTIGGYVCLRVDGQEYQFERECALDLADNLSRSAQELQ
jgi:hypothetical protein